MENKKIYKYRIELPRLEQVLLVLDNSHPMRPGIEARIKFIKQFL